MKTLKYALAILLLAVVTDSIMVAAYSSPGSIQTIRYLEGNTAQYGEYLTKNVRGRQSYVNKETYTTLTNPCNDCEIKVTAELKGGGGSGTIFITRGQTKTWNNTGLWELGDYRLQTQRVGFTLLTTYHFGTWNINKII